MQIVLPRDFVTFFTISLLMMFALDYNDNIKKTTYRLTVTTENLFVTIGRH